MGARLGRWAKTDPSGEKPPHHNLFGGNRHGHRHGLRASGVVEIRSKILSKKWEIEHKGTNDEIVEIRRFLRIEFLQPLYAEMRKILREKLYLLDTSEMPQSFKDFLS